MPAPESVGRDGTRTVRGRRVDAQLLERPSRQERSAAIEELAARGLSTSEIAHRLGLKPQTVNKYRRDPEGARERANRERYRGTCQRCGRPTSGQGPDRAKEWCNECANGRPPQHTDEQLLQAIRDWAKETGQPPRWDDWSPAHAPTGHPGAARYRNEPGRWPNSSVVARRFGSFGAAVKAAGLTRTSRSRRR